MSGGEGVRDVLLRVAGNEGATARESTRAKSSGGHRDYCAPLKKRQCGVSPFGYLTLTYSARATSPSTAPSAISALRGRGTRRSPIAIAPDRNASTALP